MGSAPPVGPTTDLDPGLNAAEVSDRHRRGLGNDAPAPTSRSLAQILRANVFTRFNALLAVLLGVIVVVGPFQDGLFGVILVLNTAIGVAQEWRAKRTLDRLAVLTAPVVAVRREGRRAEVAPSDLVVGDVVELQRGDQVPVDGTVIEGGLEVDEALLSGESDPVSRPPGSAVLSGSFVSSGSGAYRVERVGADSYAQRLAVEARRFTTTGSELQQGVNLFLRIVSWALLPVTTVLIVSQLLSRPNLVDAIRACVAGVGAMIPEGLILLTSVAFALGALRLARRRVVVQELAAVEGLARVDVLCLDKTGTLTMGGLAVDGVEPDGDPAVAAALGALAAVEANPNPTATALAARWPTPGWEARAAVAFSSARKWSGADFGPQGVWVLGAPDVLGAGALGARVEELAAAGQRVVLLARAADLAPSGVEPVALVRLVERVRANAADTIAFFRRQGVSIKVLSGDHPATVGAVAAAVGIEGADRPVDARTLNHDELAVMVESRSVFGRVSPQQKRAMIAALQARGHTVAMTGDGVNDVLALKDADIGVAMGSGSSASRGVAQLVLLDDSFAALPPVIGEGRRVMANVERVANLFITKTVYATLIAFAIGVSGAAYPFLPRHMTLVSDFTIGIPAFVLALLPSEQPWRVGFVRRVLRFTIPSGTVVGAATLVAYFLARAARLALDQQRAVATFALVGCGLWVLVLVARPMNRLKAMLVASMAGFVAALVAVPWVRRVFALQLPPAAQFAELTAIVVVASATLELVARWSALRHADPETA